MQAPRGNQISCKGWQQEGALRLFLNSRELEAGSPGNEESVGAVALAQALRGLENDRTLLVKYGSPAGTFKTGESSARILILDNCAKQSSALQDGPGELDRLGSYLFGQSASHSWASAREQDTLYATFLTFALAAQKHFDSDLAGKLVAAGGMGQMGGAQPLAATMNGAAFLGVEADAEKILARIRMGYCDFCVNDLEEALRILKNAVRQKQPISVGLVGNCAEVFPELAQRGVVPDLLTDQTPANGLHGYIPAGLSPQQAAELRQKDSHEYEKRSRESLTRHRAAVIDLERLGAVAFDFGNGLMAAPPELDGGKPVQGFPHLASAYFLQHLRTGFAPVRWFALSGERGDMTKVDEALLQLFPQDEILTRWIRMANRHVRFRGLPARVCWLNKNERESLGEKLHDLMARGEVAAPIVVARDYFDFKIDESLHSAPGESAEGGDEVSPIREIMLKAASGASWASFRRSAGPGRVQVTGRAVVVDGAPQTAERLRQLLSSDD